MHGRQLICPKLREKKQVPPYRLLLYSLVTLTNNSISRVSLMTCAVEWSLCVGANGIDMGVVRKIFILTRNTTRRAFVYVWKKYHKKEHLNSDHTCYEERKCSHSKKVRFSISVSFQPFWIFINEDIDITSNKIKKYTSRNFLYVSVLLISFVFQSMSL